MEGIVITLILGAIAGWLGSLFYQGSSLGLIGNIVVGILGSYIGNWCFGKLGVSLGSGLIGSILTAAIGAFVLLAIVNLIARNR